MWSLEVNHSKSVYSWFTLGRDILKEPVELRMDGKILEWDKKPKYLGVILDQKLTMCDHIQQVRETASEKLNIVKKLAGTKWGARADVLRGLYMGAVRSHLDYSLPVQVWASQTTLASLDAVQNQAIRLICGTFRTTPIAAGEIMANIPPLKLRRERAVILAHERYMRLEDGCPLRSLVDNWEGRRRLHNRPCFMHVARGLVREANLPVERAALSPSGSIFPMEAIGMPTIRKSLLDPVVTRQSHHTRLLQAARETIASYPAGVTTIYTDGSVQTLEGTVKAGYGR
ncbi:uncharacterized protein LOC129924681 [Biomphalaria glabrata]|uniref:Uncharacterized protein LOC129924681 n=1 Tax=Biomphalaria glabrata TaxID=6526 RepID=A0A9W2ZQ31_BIOGL|nr:uncharacterized protein LOC129924681 [Biomphalaria glabrata]